MTSIWNNFDSIAMTILSFFLMISFTTFVTIIPSILAIMYWIPKIRNEQVKKYYNGSWFSWAKASFKLFKWKK